MTTIVPVDEKIGRGYIAPLLYFNYYPYQSLHWVEQDIWRRIVDMQPIATLCRETVVERLITTDWRVEPKDPTKRQELRTEIEYYEDLFEQNDGLDWTGFLEWVLSDALDLPFGAGVDLIYRGDDPTKRLVDFVPLDGATLFPTNSREYPVVQRPPQVTDFVVFPKHAINRLYYSPRRELKWRGWGMPPPEKIYMALQMLTRGDEYYWKFLTDNPPAGVLDLLDMERESAEDWIQATRELLMGTDVLKIPVIYEHEKPAVFIPFGKDPSQISFDTITLKYAAITAAGYGLTLGDIGVRISANGGETLAGTIRDERTGNKKGIGFAKHKVRLFMNRMLPKSLKFIWIDPDDEQQVSRGRAKLSSATAYASLIDNRVISHREARADYIASGLSSTTLAEDMSEEDMKELEDMNLKQNAPQRQNMLTATQPPSVGGQGEVRAADLEIERAVLEYVSQFPKDLEFADEVDFVEFLSSAKRLDRSILIPAVKGCLEASDEVIEFGINKTEANIVKMLFHAKSLALDFSEEIDDNFQNTFAGLILEDLATNLKNLEENND